MGGACGDMIKGRNANWKERQPQRVGCRWNYNIKTDLNTGWEGKNGM